MQQKGKYLVIEGTDGSGKTTVSAQVIKKLRDRGITVWAIHEPGSTPIGEAIRAIVKDGNLERTALTELLLFTASRTELIEQIQQKLNSGVWVVSSRNYLSSIIYQGLARGLGMDYVQKICDDLLPDFYRNPDLTVIIDVDIATASGRRQQRDFSASRQDAFESRDDHFQQQLIDGYRTIADKNQLPLLNGSNSIEQLADQIDNLIREHLC